MDKIEKALQKLLLKERKMIAFLLRKVFKGNLQGLDIKKLKGREDIFRVRKGAFRIIYRIQNNKIYILATERRKEDAYRL